jgi:hypothetical protein
VVVVPLIGRPLLCLVAVAVGTLTPNARSPTPN